MSKLSSKRSKELLLLQASREKEYDESMLRAKDLEVACESLRWVSQEHKNALAESANLHEALEQHCVSLTAANAEIIMLVAQNNLLREEREKSHLEIEALNLNYEKRKSVQTNRFNELLASKEFEDRAQNEIKLNQVIIENKRKLENMKEDHLLETERLKTQYDELVTTFKEERSGYENRLAMKGAEIASLSAKMMQGEAEKNSDKKRLDNEHNLVVEELSKNNSSLTRQLNHANQEKIRLEQETHAITKNLREEYEDRVSVVTNDGKSLLDELKMARLESKSASKKLESQKETFKFELNSMELKINELESILLEKKNLEIGLQQELTSSRQDCIEKHEQLSESRRLLNEERQNFEKSNKKVTESMVSQVKVLRHKIELSDSDMIKLKNALASMEEEKSSAELHFTIRVKDLMTSHAEEFGKQNNELKRLRSDFNKISSESTILESASRREVAKKDMELLEKSQKIRINEKNLSDVLYELEKSRSNIKLMESDKDNKIKELRLKLESCEEIILKSSEKNTRELKKIQQETEIKLRTAYDSHRKELEKHSSVLIQENERLKVYIKNLAFESESYKVSVNDISREMEEKNNNILLEAVHAEKKILEDYRELTNAEHEKRCRKFSLDIKTQHESMEKMLTDFEQAKSFLMGEIENSSLVCKEWERKYLNREARPDDEIRLKNHEAEIERLNKKLEQEKGQLSRAMKEVKNREECLSKMFGSVPIVGSLSPKIKYNKNELSSPIKRIVSAGTSSNSRERKLPLILTKKVSPVIYSPRKTICSPVLSLREPKDNPKFNK